MITEVEKGLGMGDKKLIMLDIAEIHVGYQARGRIDEDLDGNFSIIRSLDFDEYGKLKLDEVMRFFPSANIDPKKNLISIGDILVQARGQSHLAYLVDQTLKNTVAANSFYVIQVVDQARAYPAYLAWWINQPKVQAYFEQEQGVSTIPFISKTVLSEAPIQIPSLEMQKKVTELNLLWQKEQGLLQLLTQKKEIFIQAAARKAVEQSMEDK